MTERQKKKYLKMFNFHSPSVASISIKKVPNYVRAEIPKDIFEQATKSPMLNTSQGFILLNEDWDDFESRKTALVSLDWLTRSLLLDVYDMERERYKDIDSNTPEKFDDPKEKIRRVYAFLMNTLLDAQDPETHI